MRLTVIEARDLPDLWFQAVRKVLDVGRAFEIDRGSYAGHTRLEYDLFLGHVKQPWFGSGTSDIIPIIPPGIQLPPPTSLGYLYGDNEHERSYIEYVMSSRKMGNESYTYGERLTGFELTSQMWKWMKNKESEIVVDEPEIWTNESIIFRGDNGKYYVNQINLCIWTYKNTGFRNNQMVLQVAKPDDMLLKDPPCLRHIQTRIQDGALHFHIYFRSWDLWGGMPSNLAGIEYLQKYMAEEIGVEQGEFFVESLGLHLYGYAEDLAKMRCMVDI